MRTVIKYRMPCFKVIMSQFIRFELYYFFHIPNQSHDSLCMNLSGLDFIFLHIPMFHLSIDYVIKYRWIWYYVFMFEFIWFELILFLIVVST